MDLFSAPHTAPLAERLRPQSLSEIIGQQHLLAADTPFMQALSRQRIPSMIFWGPPGIGKTTIAQIIAKEMKKPFRQLSAIQSGVKDVRTVLTFAKRQPGTILFIDEIHRFNKAQQDSLLGAVEKGYITLIGATTENPSFEVISALLSRCQVYTLNPLSQEEVNQLLQRAITHDAYLAEKDIQLKETEAIYRIGAGDARKTLALLEMFINSQKDEPILMTDEAVQQIAQTHVALYDKTGEQHYDIISAFIKSIRGGDPDGAVYWLARMIEGGEDVKFIARRLIIVASEDVGNANPNALLLANACFQSVNVIGLPEARIILSQVTTYLATSEKSNAAYMAIGKAQKTVRATPPYPVPLPLRNAPTRLMKSLGYGKDYKYTHNYEGREREQQYLPDELKGEVFYEPKDVGGEKKIRQFLAKYWGRNF